MTLLYDRGRPTVERGDLEGYRENMTPPHWVEDLWGIKQGASAGLLSCMLMVLQQCVLSIALL